MVCFITKYTRRLLNSPGKVVLHDKDFKWLFGSFTKEEDCGGNLDKGYTLFCKAMEECYGTEGLKKATELYHFDTETDEIMGLMSEYIFYPKRFGKRRCIYACKFIFERISR